MPRPCRAPWPVLAVGIPIFAVLGAALAQDGFVRAVALEAPRTAEVAAAERDLAAAEAAWAEEQRALDAGVRFEPSWSATVRDDPPRPAESALEGVLSAEVVWYPRRNGLLVAEARVWEARLDLRGARRQALYLALRAPAEAGRARHFLRQARAELAEARAALAEAQVQGDAARAVRAAELDVRAAELEVASRARAVASWRDAPARPELPGAGAWPERPRFALPQPRGVAESLAARARALRDAAAVALAERRATAAWWEEAEAEVAYFGADARFGASVGVRGGRPRAEAEAALRGTPRERWTLSLSAEFRLGTDTPGALEAVVLAREEAARNRAARREAWEATSRAVRAETRAREAAWEIAEERLALAQEAGEEAAVASARHAARRAWLRYLRAVEDDLAHFEAPWRLRRPAAGR